MSNNKNVYVAIKHVFGNKIYGLIVAMYFKQNYNATIDIKIINPIDE
jgi:hypothetical protein